MRFTKMVPYVRFQRLTGIAVTDHESFEFHRQPNEDTGIQIIKGMEVKTESGDITGLFLEKKIEHTHAKEVVREIKDQGGLVLLPHPFRDNNIYCISKDILEKTDLIELYNARYNARKPSKREVSLIRKIAQKYKITPVAGSDAHNYHEIGRAKTSTTQRDLKKALMEGNVNCHLIPQMCFLPIYIRFASVLIGSLKKDQFGLFILRLKEFLQRF